MNGFMVVTIGHHHVLPVPAYAFGRISLALVSPDGVFFEFSFLFFSPEKLLVNLRGRDS